MSVAAFSQITQEDYDKLPNETRTQIEKITTEKAIKGEIKEVSEYANLGKEIGVAVNETLKAVEDSAKNSRFQSRADSNNYCSMETSLQRNSWSYSRHTPIRNILIYASNWSRQTI